MKKKQEEATITIVDFNGNAVQYEVLLTFENTATRKEYVVFTDKSKDTDGSIRVFAAIYQPQSCNALQPITTDEEWAYVADVLNSAQNNYLKEQ